jgi:hypothetical protein
MMSSAAPKQEGILRRIFKEAVEYWIIVCYLAIVFAAFTWYRRLLLASYGITYTNYWVAVIKALVLGKVIMIGEVLRIGRGLEKKPLIIPTLYKTLVFTLFLAIFTVLENVFRGLWKGTGFTGNVVEYLGVGLHEFFANSLVVFVTFIPFFGVKELSRVIGQDKIRALFFRSRTDKAPESLGPKDV